jgi:hypothetical protein
MALSRDTCEIGHDVKKCKEKKLFPSQILNCFLKVLFTGSSVATGNVKRSMSSQKRYFVQTYPYINQVFAE